MKLNNVNVLIDPFISNNPCCPIALNQLPKIDYILVTHGHSDHLGDTVAIATKFNSTVICNYEISLYLSKHNIICHAMHIGGKASFNFGQVKMLPALHGSSISESDAIIYAGNPCGFLINADNKKIYHAGDTGLTLEMTLLELENIDICMLPIGGNFTMDIDDALRALAMIKPKLAIPMHYDTFPIIKQDPQLFKTNNKVCNTLILQFGEELKI